MVIKFSDNQIDALIKEPKSLVDNFRDLKILKSRKGHKENEIKINGQNNNQFKIVLLQSSINPLDFSIILGVYSAQSNQLFRLRRYNGKSHEHSNKIEKIKFFSFHIHTATERYQKIGAKEDTFAETTSRYSDFNSAVDCLVEDCGIIKPDDSQRNRFEDI